MKYFEAIMNGITAVIKVFLATASAVMLTGSFIEIIRRYFFGLSWAWSDELMRYLIVAIAFLGGAVGFRAKALPCFDLLMSKMSARVQQIFALIVQIIIAVMLVFLIVQTSQSIMTKSILSGVSIGLRIPMLVPYLPIPVSFGLMLLFDFESMFAKTSSRSWPLSMYNQTALCWRPLRRESL